MNDHGLAKRTTVVRVQNRGFALWAGLALCLFAQPNAAAQGGSVEGDPSGA